MNFQAIPKLYGTNVVPADGPSPCEVMLIGEAPGETDNQTFVPFCGKAGDKLNKALNDAGKARRSVYVTNAVKCRPPLNRQPTWSEILLHRPFLIQEVNEVRPFAIITLGTTATRALLKREKLNDSILNYRYKFLYVCLGRVRLFVTYHPAQAVDQASIYDLIVKDFKRSFKWVESKKELLFQSVR